MKERPLERAEHFSTLNWDNIRGVGCGLGLRPKGWSLTSLVSSSVNCLDSSVRILGYQGRRLLLGQDRLREPPAERLLLNEHIRCGSFEEQLQLLRTQTSASFMMADENKPDSEFWAIELGTSRYVEANEETIGDVTTGNGHGKDEETPKLSKNQQKKLLKQQRYEEKKAAKKREEKERRHADVQRKKREWAELLDSLPPEEREEAWAKRIDGRKERRIEGETRRARMLEAMGESGGQDVVIDLEWSHLMTSKELKSLTKQVMFCYSANSRAEKPMRLHLTGCTGEVHEQLQLISGYQKWLLHKHSEPYFDAFAARRQDLVYLTADASEVVDRFRPDKVYIIGGLVDRNRHKNCTLAKAKEQGIATARLPIGEHMKLNASMVLTVNQVLDTMLRFVATGDWQQALDETVPLRKRAASEEHPPSRGRSPDGAKAEEDDAAEDVALSSPLT